MSVWGLKVWSEGNVLESEAPAAPREVSSTRWDCFAPWELRSASACLAMAMGSCPSYAADIIIDVVGG